MNDAPLKSYRLRSQRACLDLWGDADETIHIGREFYRTCRAAGLTVTAQVVLAGGRYQDSVDADSLFRPKDQ